MKICALILATAFPALSVSVGGELILSEGRESGYQIVIPDKSPSVEIDESLVQTARLLQTAFKANGASLAVVRESEHGKIKAPGIYLGNTTFAQQHDVDVTALKDWSYVHRVVGKLDLVLAGHDHPAPAKSDNPRRPEWDRVGTAKAVTDFLREYAGVRFLFPEISPYRALPRASEIDLLASPSIEFLPMPRITVPDDLNSQRTPAIRYNTAHPQGGGFYDLANNRFPLVDEVRGGHTWERAIPADPYRKTNPEYFALRGGKRLLEGNGQYCLSNPEVQELIYQDLARHLDKGYASVDIGQPDGFRACECDSCESLYDTGDDWREKIWTFNRAMAERLLKSHPHQRISMMSYIQTAHPPEAFQKFPANTTVMLTGTNEEDIEPWRGHEVPSGFSGYLYNWCPNLGTRYTPMRTPLFVEKQAKRLKENHIKGFNRDGPGALYGLEGPVYYTMGRIYDDPENLFARDLVPEFVEAAFGESAWHMTRFYDRLYHTITLYSDHIGTRSPVWTYEPLEGRRRKTIQDPFRMIAFLYPPSVLADLEELLSAAENKARNSKVKERLALVRREFDYVTHFARVVHLHQAFQIQPDFASRNRLLDAIDARNAVVDSYYGDRGRPTPVSEGWSYVMFPPAGHNAAHLRLAHNGYQEPYENTCFNWDTAEMRSAPLPGAKQLHVDLLQAKTPISLNSPEWKSADSHPLQTISGDAKSDSKIEFRVLAGTKHIHVRVDTQEASSGTGIAIFFEPSPGKERVFRFLVEPATDKKDEAAAGLIRDAMDPRFGQYDPDWKGEWICETRVNSTEGTRQVLFSVPYATMGTAPPEPGSFWRANVAHFTETNVTTWSKAPGMRNPDNRDGFGEWLLREKEGVGK